MPTRVDPATLNCRECQGGLTCMHCHPQPSLEQTLRIAELEKALADCTAFVAIHVDKWARDNGGAMHETHRELLDRIGRLTGRSDLVERLTRVVG